MAVQRRAWGVPSGWAAGALLLLLLVQPGAALRGASRRLLASVQTCQPLDVPPENRCAYVTQQEACEPDGWFNYLEFHYCYLDEMEVVSTVLFSTWIVLLFAIMLVGAERFFCPSIELISEYLKLSPCVAGATLLSFGNGAPDVFTQLAAISQGAGDESTPGGIAMALSEPLGSGLFVGNIVFALVILLTRTSHQVEVQKKYFLKDVIFYLGGVAMVFGFLLHGTVSIWQCVLLGVYYVTFVATTIYVSRGDEPVHSNPQLHEVPHAPIKDSYLRDSVAGSMAADFLCHNELLYTDSEPEDTVPLLGGSSRQPANAQAPEGRTFSGGPSYSGAPGEGRDGRTFSGGPGDIRTFSGGPGEGRDCLTMSHSGVLQPVPEVSAIEFHDAPSFVMPGETHRRMKRLWRVLERPLLALLSTIMARIDNSNHARYRKAYALALPIVLPTLYGLAAGWLSLDMFSWRQPWWMASTFLGVIIASGVYCYYPRRGHLHGRAAGIAVVLTFIVAMMLLDDAAGELVNTAVALGQIYGIPPTLLGGTILAWGNSVSDLVSNITLAQDGYPTMAITACFASPMFVLLAGLVTSLTYATRYGDLTLPGDIALRVLYACSMTILITWALVVPNVFKYKLNRKAAVLAICMYFAYQTVYIYAIIHDNQQGLHA